MKPYLSIVIPMFNLASSIGVTMRWLAAQTLDPAEFEIIFVDDCSTDGTAEIVSQWQTPVTFQLIRNERNLGRARTRNRGWQAASGVVIVFLDGDMLAGPGLLEAYKNAFVEKNADVVSGRRYCLDLRGQKEEMYPDRIATLAGKRDLEDVFKEDPGAGFALLKKETSLGQRPDVTQVQLERDIEQVCNRYPRSLTRALAFITSNVAVKRNFLVETGGFYPFLLRAEDTGLGLRLAERGARFKYLPTAEAIHPFWAPPGDFDLYAVDFLTLQLQYPYNIVVAWYLWAQYVASGAAGGANSFPGSLVELARMESNGGLDRLDVVSLFERDSFYSLPGRFEITEEQLCDYYWYRCRIPASRMAEYIRRALHEGLIVRRTNEGVLFNFLLFRVWLEDKTDFREFAYRHGFFRRHWRAHQDLRTEAGPRELQWTGKYSVTIPEQLLRTSSSDVYLNLPLPGSSPCQIEASVTDCDPPHLFEYAERDMIVGFPFGKVSTSNTTISYHFSCTVSEWVCPLACPDDPQADHLDRWLGPGHAPATMLRLYEMLGDVVALGAGTCSQRAAAIYQWMLDNFRYKASPFDDVHAVTSGLGHCAQFSRVFVNLCRLAGVPARTRHGALVDWYDPAGPGDVAVTRDYFTPFVHTWAEFFSIEENGWVPVELLPLGHGERIVTEENFPDARLRAQMIDEGPQYDSFYFAKLDAFRIYGSPYVAWLPTLVRRENDRWLPFATGIELRHEMIFHPPPELAGAAP